MNFVLKYTNEMTAREKPELKHIIILENWFIYFKTGFH